MWESMRFFPGFDSDDVSKDSALRDETDQPASVFKVTRPKIDIACDYTMCAI